MNFAVPGRPQLLGIRLIFPGAFEPPADELTGEVITLVFFYDHRSKKHST
jgi:hypothetical protein